VEEGPTRRFGGTGLGLSIVRDYLDLHRGVIDVGDAPEGGALFTLAIPRLEPPDGKAARPSLPASLEASALAELEELRPREEPMLSPVPGELPLVLVVDDNPQMRRFLAELLLGQYRVATAADGRDGLEKALRLRPDLILTDLMMPEAGGEGLIQRLREHAELDHVPIVVVTAKAQEEVRLRVLRAGAQDYLMKPFVPEEVRTRISTLLAIKRSRDLLQHELASRTQSLETLVGELAASWRELQTALDSVSVARDHAERAAKLKTTFLRLVSHELRTPLTTVLLGCDRLERDRELGLGPRQRQVLRRMTAAATRLADLIESLLEYARGEAGRLAMQVEEIDVGKLVSSTLEELRPQAEEKKLSLRLELPAGLRPTRTDARLLRLVLVNLVANAIKFTETGTVEVCVEQTGGEIQFSVRDSGPGVPPEEQVRIFEPFEQLEPVTGKHQRGVGLGLALVKEMVGALGGRISLRSQVGEGSTFTVALPERDTTGAPS
jgi:signal transduction histidine kinase